MRSRCSTKSPQQHPATPPANGAHHPKPLHQYPRPEVSIGALSKAECLGGGVKKVEVRIFHLHRSTIPNINRARHRPKARTNRAPDRFTRTCVDIPAPWCRLGASPPPRGYRAGPERAW